MNNRGNGNAKQDGDGDTDQPGAKTDDHGFRIEHAGNVPFGSADGAKNADFFGAFQNGDIGDNADHDGGNHKRNGNKGNQYIGDDVDDGCDRGHDKRNVIGIANLVFLVFGFVVVFDDIRDCILVLKCGGINGDAGRFIRIDNTEQFEIVFIGGVGGAGGGILFIKNKCGLFIRVCNHGVKHVRYIIVDLLLGNGELAFQERLCLLRSDFLKDAFHIFRTHTGNHSGGLRVIKFHIRLEVVDQVSGFVIAALCKNHLTVIVDCLLQGFFIRFGSRFADFFFFLRSVLLRDHLAQGGLYHFIQLFIRIGSKIFTDGIFRNAHFFGILFRNGIFQCRTVADLFHIFGNRCVQIVLGRRAHIVHINFGFFV